MCLLAADLAKGWRAGDVVLLSGPLGAGKTTFCRCVLASLGWRGIVRSPTFTLVNLYETEPAAAHVDLYRVEAAVGLGLEEVLDERLCLIEWPDRLQGLVDVRRCWRIAIEFGTSDDERLVEVLPPSVLG